MTRARTIDLDTMVERREDVVFSEVDGEIVAMSIQSGKYYGLQEIGSRIWDIIDDPISISKICEALMAEYDVTADQCNLDVLRFMEKLWNKDLIRLVDQKPA